jgi:membrane-anchored protein YejM (alkaline phosphatase superfamily)
LPFFQSVVHRDTNLWGSDILAAFKRVGYSIHVISATPLDYLNSDQVIFGKGVGMADTFSDSRDQEPGSIEANFDKPAMDLLLEMAGRAPPQGQIFLFFFDATHHDYYWPPDFPARFQPYAPRDRFNYWVGTPAKAQLIKNRYLNAVAYLDSLFGQFLAASGSISGFRESIVAVVGDHGEEFLECGQMTHGGKLDRIQCEIPILIRLPQELSALGSQAHGVLSQVDVLPTVLDAVSHQVYAATKQYWNGRSAFDAEPRVAVTVAGSAAHVPRRFVLCDGATKLWCAFGGVAKPQAVCGDATVWRATDIEDRQVRCDSGCSSFQRCWTLFSRFSAERKSEDLISKGVN